MGDYTSCWEEIARGTILEISETVLKAVHNS